MRFIIHRLKSCPSTNNVARDMAGLGAPEGTVVVAEEQTAGRGTKGRSWHSPRGKGLYASLIVRPAPEEMPLIPLAAGVAVRDAVESSSGLRVLLRWPNDIVWQGKKLGGVLCEGGFLGNRPEYAILGVGLNVDHGPLDFPDDIREQAVSIRMTARKPAKIKRVLKHLLAAFEKWRAALAAPAGREEIVRTFESHSIFKKGDSVTVVEDGISVQGQYQGIGPDGRLELLIGNDLRRLSSAEIARII